MLMGWKRKAALAAAGFGALIVNVAAWAQNQNTTENLDGVSGRDAILDVFGVDAETLASAISTAGNSGSILASVAGVVNFAALLAAVVIILLTFVSAILQTGEHGKVGGRFSMVWVPIRSTIALLFLMPLSIGGYSVIQAVVLWLGLQGSGLADQAWAQSTEYMSEKMTLSRPVPPRKVGEITSALLQMEMCALALERSALGDGSAQANYSATRPEGFVQVVQPAGWAPALWSSTERDTRVLSYDGAGDAAGTRALCGEIKLEREHSSSTTDVLAVRERNLNEAVLTRQSSNILRTRNDVALIAEGLYNGSLTTDLARQELLRIEGRYAESEQQLQRLVNAEASAQEVILRNKQLQASSEKGWLLAGAYYMSFAAYDATLNAKLSKDPDIAMPRPEQMSSGMIRDVSPWLIQAARVAPRNSNAPNMTDLPRDLVAGETGVGGAANLIPVVALYNATQQLSSGDIEARIDAQVRQLFDQAVNTTVGDGVGVVSKMTTLGNIILDNILLIFSGLAIIGAGGFLFGPKGVVILLSLLGLGLFILPLGILLAYVVPAIPFLIWTAAVAGWMLMLVQATVAAPLWAAAHAAPEGEGFASQHARTGYLLLIGLVARPVLMIVGLMASMLVLDFMGMYVVKVFNVWTASAMGNNSAGALALGAWLCIFGALMVVLVRWSFSLITFIPNTVLNFIGAGAQALGETEMAEQARTMAVGAWMALQRGVGGAASRAGGLLNGPAPGGGGTVSGRSA